MEATFVRPLTLVDDEIIAEGGNEEDERFGYCYYRLATGWIVQGRADPASIETYKRKGATALVESYGRFVFNPALMKDRRGNSLPQWQPYFQPYDKLLLEAPHEFPLEQIVAYHWHHGCTAQQIEYLPDGRYRTHRRRVTFPQLAGKVIPEHLCVICGRSFNEYSELNTHTRMAHPEQGTILKLAETQQAIANAITVAQGGGAGDAGLAAVLQQVMTTQVQMAEVLQSVLKNQNQGAVAERTYKKRVLTPEQREKKRLYEQQRRQVAVVTEGETDAELHSPEQ